MSAPNTPSGVSDLIAALRPLGPDLPVLFHAGSDAFNLDCFTTCVQIQTRLASTDARGGYVIADPSAVMTPGMIKFAAITGISNTNDPDWRPMPPKTVKELLADLLAIDPDLPVLAVYNAGSGKAGTINMSIEIMRGFPLDINTWLIAWPEAVPDGIRYPGNGTYAGLPEILAITPRSFA